jgi:hypothetical protein
VRLVAGASTTLPPHFTPIPFLDALQSPLRLAYQKRTLLTISETYLQIYGVILHERKESMRQSHAQPLIGLIFEENGQEVVRYFTEEKAADAAVSRSATQKALGVIGAWSDLDWDETVAALDRIRHESKPTPPIKL